MMYRKIQIELLLVGCLFVLLSCAGEKASVSESASSQISVLASDTLLPVKRDGLYGYADITGNVVIPCQWIEAGSFREGLAQIMNKKRKIGFAYPTVTVILSQAAGNLDLLVYITV